MKTDLERLHQVFEGKISGRGCGTTFLTCHLLAGMIEVCTPREIYVGVLIPNPAFMLTLKYELPEIFEEYEIQILDTYFSTHWMVQRSDGLKVHIIFHTLQSYKKRNSIFRDPSMVNFDNPVNFIDYNLN